MNKLTRYWSRTFMFLLLIKCADCAHAQIGPLTAGQPLPFHESRSVINHNSKTIDLSSYKNKLLLINFWGIYCIPCIEAFPKIDSLQRKFAKDIQIVNVSSEKIEVIEKFFREKTHIKMPDIPFITSDTTLSRYFPHTGVPHHVWIDQNGIFRKASFGYFLTEDILKKAINGNFNEIELYRPKTILPSLFKDEVKENVLFSVAVFKPGRQRFSIKMDHDVNFFSETGAIDFLYRSLYTGLLQGRLDMYKHWRVWIESADKERIQMPRHYIGLQAGTWQAENNYTFQLRAPKEMTIDKYEIMKSSLSQFFKIDAKLENRKIDSYTLVKVTRKQLKEDLHFQANSPQSVQGLSVTIKENLDFNELKKVLANLFESEKPFVSEVNLKGEFTLKIPKYIGKRLEENLNSQLSAYGLKIIHKPQFVEVLVLR